jgi:hypothetical protein
MRPRNCWPSASLRKKNAPSRMRPAGRKKPMRQDRLAHLIHEQTAAIAALERRIGTHATIRRILRLLALEEIPLGQAIGILDEAAERSPDPEQQVVYQQVIAALRQTQAEKP